MAPTAKALRSRRDLGSMSSRGGKRNTGKPVEIAPAAIRICQKNRRILKALEYKASISERHRRSKQKSPGRGETPPLDERLRYKFGECGSFSRNKLGYSPSRRVGVSS